MVIDTSAIVAVLRMAPEAPQLALAIESDPIRLVSTATVLEAGIVIESRYGGSGAGDLDLFLAKIGAVIEPVTSEQADAARDAWRRFGKGRHGAGLNFGDCFSYALARCSGEPLLFTGNDFSQTDIGAVSY